MTVLHCNVYKSGSGDCGFFLISACITGAKISEWKTVARRCFFCISLENNRTQTNILCFDVDETSA